MNSTSGVMTPFAYYVAIAICVLVQSVLVYACQNVTLNDCKTVNEGFCLPQNYNKKERPNMPFCIHQNLVMVRFATIITLLL